MPKLPNYTAKLDGSGPGAGGRRAVVSDFETGIGEVGQGLGRAGLALLSQQEEQEARQALVASSEIRAKYAKALDEAAISGAPTAPLRDQMAADLAKVGEGFATKQGADTATLDANKAFSMFDNEANRINVHRAGAEAKQGAEKMIANEAQAINSNPGYLPQAIENITRYVETFAGKLPPETRSAIIDDQAKRLNLEAARTMIRLDPEAGRKMLDEGKWNLSPEQLTAAQGYARESIDYQQRAKEHEAALRRQEARERSDKEESDIASLIYRGKVDKAMETRILDNPAFASDPGAKMRMMALITAQTKRMNGEEREGSKTLMTEMWHQINNGELFNPQAVIDKVKDNLEGRRGLDMRQADYLLAQMRNMKDGSDQTFRRQLSSAIGRQERSLNQDYILNATPQGQEVKKQIITEMISDVESRAEALRRTGDKGTNPDALLDPNSKDYYFTPKRIEELKARVVAREMGSAVAAELGRSAPKVRGIDDPALLNLKDGDPFTDENGNVRKMTAAIRQKAKAAGAGQQFPITPSGETPQAQKAREAAATSEKYRAARRGE